MNNHNEIDAAAFNEKYFTKLYPQMVAYLRKQYGVVRLAEDMTDDQLGAGNVAVGSAFLTTFSHFQKGEFDGLSEERLVAEFARVVYNRWHRTIRDSDRKHVSYSASRPDEERPHFERAVDGQLPEDEAQYLEYFREVVGKVNGRLTAVNPKYLEVIRAFLGKLGTQEEIAVRCGCGQAMVSRALNWLYDAIGHLQRQADD